MVQIQQFRPAGAVLYGLLGRQGFYESFTKLNPVFQVFISRNTFGSNIDQPFHGSPRKIHFPGVLMGKALFVLIRPDSGHKCVADNAAAHVTVHHEAQPAKHFLTLNFGSALEVFL